MMSNALATHDSLLKGLQTVTARPVAASGGKPFLRLARHGAWIYGAEGTEVNSSDVWAVNPYSARKGHIAWGDSEVLGEQMVSVSSPDVDPADLPRVGAEWKYQLGIDLVCVKGTDKGQEVSYSVTSVGGIRALTNLFNDIANRVGTGGDDFVPLVNLKVSHYPHKKYGKIFTPILENVGWNTMDSKEVPEDSPADTDEWGEPVPPTRTRNRVTS
jgi:hypothetical protein